MKRIVVVIIALLILLSSCSPPKLTSPFTPTISINETTTITRTETTPTDLITTTVRTTTGTLFSTSQSVTTSPLSITTSFTTLPTTLTTTSATQSITRTTVTTSSPQSTTAASPELDVYYFDVGQGDAILLDQGSTEILIDAGTGSVNVANLIKPYVDGPLEVVIATHMDADHIGGLSAVLSAYKVLNVWDNGSTSTSATYNRFKAAILSSGAVEHIGRRGSTITAGFMAFTVLNPVDTTGTSNNNSIVLKLNYGNVSFQFEGDAEREAESSMLAAGLLSHVDFLKVGHHGSSTASSSSFLKATSPTVAVYMAGVGNSYGHPHPETITALTQIGAIIYGTDKHGTIEIKTDGKVYNLSASRSPTTTVVQSTVPTIPTITTVSTTTPKTTTIAITTTTITTTTTTTQPYTTTTTTTPQTSSSETVYITNTGTKYHRAGCRYLSSSCIPISKAEAIARGLTPCSVCNP